MTRTSRQQPGYYATPGATAQEGKLPVYVCNTCSQEVVWATSARTSRKYLANVSRGVSDSRYYVKRDLHDCARRLAYLEQFDLEATASSAAECHGERGLDRGSW